MTADERRIAAITQAAEHLDWCHQPPHTVDQVMGIYAEATAGAGPRFAYGKTNGQIVEAIKAQAIRIGGRTSGHSDPTAVAALWGEPDAADGDDTTGVVGAAVVSVHLGCIELDQLCTQTLGLAEWNPNPSGPTWTDKLRDATTHLHHASPHLTTASVTLDASELAHLDDLVRLHIADTAAWLHTKMVGIWQTYHGDRFQVAEQKALHDCTIHARHGYSVLADSPRKSDLCCACANFRSNHGCDPTPAVLKRWDYGQGPTPGQIIEAKAQAKRRATA